MCGFYDDNTKIKKGDIAKYKNNTVTIISCKHIKSNKTMDITFLDSQNNEMTVNIPYKTTGYGFTNLHII